MKHKIKTVADAFKAVGLDPNKLPNVSGLPERHAQAVVDYYKAVVVAEALNEGWQPDWNNHDEWKYYPWFDVKASAKKLAGSGLSCCDYGYPGSYSFVGSRLCFKSAELARYAGTHPPFRKLYESMFLLK
ncbi:MAG: hypothetical protein K1X81_02005 [Bacteroidia bacterium]|nr:hypothetical protein [Bacteroidia bacterium]